MKSKSPGTLGAMAISRESPGRRATLLPMTQLHEESSDILLRHPKMPLLR